MKRIMLAATAAFSLALTACGTDANNTEQYPVPDPVRAVYTEPDTSSQRVGTYLPSCRDLYEEDRTTPRDVEERDGWYALGGGWVYNDGWCI